LVESEQVKINGERAKPGDQVDETDTVTVGGEAIGTQERVYLVFHKPAGVISTDDPKATNTVFDYIELKEHLFYVGRLDVASSGLMLLTNDGDLAQAITKPSNEHEKEYLVKLNKNVTQEHLAEFSNGITIQGRLTKPAKITRISKSEFKIVLTEGRNRQIRRMVEALGYEVESLQRIRIMHLTLGRLNPGEWRHLNKKEVAQLLAQATE